MKTLTQLLLKNDEKALLQHYQESSEPENVSQLAYLFQQAMTSLSAFYPYQQLATKLINSKGLPTSLIGKINTNDTLSFFTSALQVKDNFKQFDQQQKNVLHYLFAGKQSSNELAAANQPPFNYVRSMMLFESNGTLRDALCQRNKQNLTAIEVYLSTHNNLEALPPHELTALLALIEIECKQQTVDIKNYKLIVSTLVKLCSINNHMVDRNLQRLVLVAIYFSLPIDDVLHDINEGAATSK